MVQPIALSKEAVAAAAMAAAEAGKEAPRFALNEFSWYSILFGYPVLGIWYWCTDQTIVQKVLAAKTEKDGRDGAIFAGFLKILPVFLMVLPGVIAYVLFQDKIPADTIEAALNSTATLTSEDIVKRIRPNIPDATLVLIGRVTAAVVVVLAMLWSTQGAKFGDIFEAINKIPMAFAPGITAVFLWGVFWPRGNRQGAMTAMVFNVIIGFVYLAVDIPLFGEKQLIAEGLGIPFMQVGWYLFLMSSAVYFIASLATPAPAKAQTEKKHKPKTCAGRVRWTLFAAGWKGRLPIRVLWRRFFLLLWWYCIVYSVKQGRVIQLNLCLPVRIR
jgi:SSS family solute:Na+ symporter